MKGSDEDIKITPETLMGVKRKSDYYFTRLTNGQFWVFKPKTLEVHDKDGRVTFFRKRTIQFADVGGQCILNPFIQ